MTLIWVYLAALPQLFSNNKFKVLQSLFQYRPLSLSTQWIQNSYLNLACELPSRCAWAANKAPVKVPSPNNISLCLTSNLVLLFVNFAIFLLAASYACIWLTYVIHSLPSHPDQTAFSIFSVRMQISAFQSWNPYANTSYLFEILWSVCSRSFSYYRSSCVACISAQSGGLKTRYKGAPCT